MERIPIVYRNTFNHVNMRTHDGVFTFFFNEVYGSVYIVHGVVAISQCIVEFINVGVLLVVQVQFQACLLYTSQYTQLQRSFFKLGVHLLPPFSLSCLALLYI